MADILELSLDLLAIILDGGNMLLGTFGLLLLFDRGDYAPGGTAGTNNILVGDGQEIALIDSQFTTELDRE